MRTPMEAGEAALRDTLYAEMLGRIKETDENAPYPRDGWFYYYSRTEEGKQYPIYARRRGSMDSPGAGDARPQRHGRGQAVHFTRRLRAERRRQQARVHPRHDRFPAVRAFTSKDLRTGAVSGPLASRVDGRCVGDRRYDALSTRRKTRSPSGRYRLLPRTTLGSGKHELLYEEKRRTLRRLQLPHPQQGIRPALSR